MIQRYQVAGLTDGQRATAIAKAIETLPMVERAFVDLDTGELVVEGEAEEPAIRDLVAAAGYTETDRI